MKVIPPCVFCKHFLESILPTGLCRAFPEEPGIPEEIFWEGQDHDDWFPGQRHEYFFEEKN